MMKIVNVLLILHTVVIAQIYDIKEEEFDCPKRVMLIENECNECYCTNHGELACTVRECTESENKHFEKCQRGTSWRTRCNKCWCISIGTVCTNIIC